MKDHDEVNAMVFVNYEYMYLVVVNYEYMYLVVVNYEYMYLVVLQLFTMKKIRNEVRWYA